MMAQAQGQHKDLIQSIEALPPVPGFSPLDQDLLMLKATSMATMTCLHDCLHILHLQQLARHHSALTGACPCLWSVCPEHASLSSLAC